MRRTLRITTGFLWLSVVLLIAGIVRLVAISHSSAGLPQAGDTLGILACTFGGIGIPVCLWLIWIYRRYARRAADIVSGANCIARWSCSAEEWDRYLMVLIQRSKKNQRVILIILGITALILIPVVSFALFATTPPGKMMVVLIVVGILFGFLALMFFICWFAIVYLPVKMVRHPGSRDVFIGSGGAVSAGKFYSWQMMGGVIKSVRYEPADPGTLLFHWSQPGLAANGGAMELEAIVPVPRANEADARRVIEYFSARFKR
jgi:hypothetical protein